MMMMMFGLLDSLSAWSLMSFRSQLETDLLNVDLIVASFWSAFGLIMPCVLNTNAIEVAKYNHCT